MPQDIPGYRLGDPDLDRPVPLADLDRMARTALFTDEDRQALRDARRILEPRVEAILDVWYGFVASQPHLIASFSPPGGPPDQAYLAAVRRRFGQWILDTTRADYDQAWVDYQIEIGRRHHRLNKNRTDGAAAEPHIRFVDLVPLVYPIFATLRSFLEEGSASPERVDAMHHAWLKALLLTVTLWSHPYVNAEDF
ncbi:MAG: protoglobin domain-containing protein [Sandaracinaceae bacterium]